MKKKDKKRLALILYAIAIGIVIYSGVLSIFLNRTSSGIALIIIGMGLFLYVWRTR